MRSLRLNANARCQRLECGLRVHLLHNRFALQLQLQLLRTNYEYTRTPRSVQLPRCKCLCLCWFRLCSADWLQQSVTRNRRSFSVSIGERRGRGSICVYRIQCLPRIPVLSSPSGRGRDWTALKPSASACDGRQADATSGRSGGEREAAARRSVAPRPVPCTRKSRSRLSVNTLSIESENEEHCTARGVNGGTSNGRARTGSVLHAGSSD